mmetsp:Transcript_5458/g.14396  ORF Transcript_5458/g.14396 Transcript_5458/m.14396 type:complete len:221 (-) Transcript_5458:1354-2016(-)
MMVPKVNSLRAPERPTMPEFSSVKMCSLKPTMRMRLSGACWPRPSVWNSARSDGRKRSCSKSAPWFMSFTITISDWQCSSAFDWLTGFPSARASAIGWPMRAMRRSQHCSMRPPSGSSIRSQRSAAGFKSSSLSTMAPERSTENVSSPSASSITSRMLGNMRWSSATERHWSNMNASCSGPKSAPCSLNASAVLVGAACQSAASLEAERSRPACLVRQPA